MRPLAAASLGLALVMGPAGADETRAQVEQRVKLAAKLLADSPAAQRIANSGNPQAVGHLDEGKLHHAMAEDALARGDLAAARREVDESLRHMGMARRMVPDAPAKQAALRQRQEQMLASLERVVESWPTRLNPDEPMDGDLFAALGLMSTARGFARESRFEEAVHTLAAAERHMLAGMRQVLGSTREVDYTQRAATPEQEYQIELQRLQGLSELVPLAVAELRPVGEAAALIERYSDTSRKLRAQAQQAAASGSTQAALAHVRNALLYLQRALQAAGVAMPPPSGSSP